MLLLKTVTHILDQKLAVKTKSTRAHFDQGRMLTPALTAPTQAGVWW
jgi:hypothetical protein